MYTAKEQENPIPNPERRDITRSAGITGNPDSVRNIEEENKMFRLPEPAV